MALLLPPRLHVLETRLHDTVRHQLDATGFNNIDVAADGQSVALRWRGQAPAGADAFTLHDSLTRAADTAAEARPDGWPFAHLSGLSDWATAPVVAAIADQSSVPDLPPPPVEVATEADPRLAAMASVSVASASPPESADTSSADSPSLLSSSSSTGTASVELAVASASASVAASCTDKVTAAISGRRLHFVSSSAQLTNDSDAVLDAVYKVVHSCPGGLRLEIDGYTDNVGPAPANLTLSSERARAAAAALVTRGLPRDMVEAHGFGEQNPVASNARDSGRAANRRVVFILKPA